MWTRPRAASTDPPVLHHRRQRPDLRARKQYDRCIVGYKNGAPVRVSDVANVIDGVENTNQAAWMNDTPAVDREHPAAAGRQHHQCRGPHQDCCLKQLQASLPPSVKVSVLTDRTTTIRASVKDVQFELMLTVALVVMVIFLFLRNLAATIIPSVAVPLSLVGTFGVMYLLGYSLDNLSLMALTISTGFVVDDAIVMIENIDRYLEEGDTPLEAALKGSGADRFHDRFADRFADRRFDSAAVHGRHCGPAVPRVRGHSQRDDSGLGAGFADADADDVSLLLRQRDQARHGRFYEWSERGFNRIIAFYGRTVQFVLQAPDRDLAGDARRPWSLTICTVHRCAQGLLPGAGYRRHHWASPRPAKASRSRPWRSVSRRSAAAILQDPDVVSLSSFIGVDGTNMTPNSGRIQINLKPRDERNATSATSSADCSRRLAGVEGITLYMQAVQDLTVEDRVSRTQYQYSLEDADPKELAIWMPKLVDKLKSLARAARRGHRPAERGRAKSVWSIDRDTASRLGFTASADRQHALRRFRPAPGLHHVHAAQPVSRGAGSRSGIPQNPDALKRHLCDPGTSGSRCR